ncbi:MAG: hypothetical protein R3336_05520 [Phycisphaeraceae bacterium]|nr:hypothetical protein [Phycisphaeraceae bacterium]
MTSPDTNPTPTADDYDRDPLATILDEDLAAEPTPELADRIFQQTRDRLSTDRPQQTGIVARIGVQRLRLITAAAILVMEFGIWMTLIGIAQDARTLRAVDQELASVSNVQFEASPIDQELQRLDRHLDVVRFGDWTEPMATRLDDPSVF